MKKRLLLTLSLVGFMGLTTLASCGTPATSSATSNTSTATSAVTSATSSATTTSATPVNTDGGFSYVASSYADRTKIIGSLESYAYKNHLTGIPLYENGGYAMYASRVVKGTNSYIPGYGFGILGEGSLSSDMTSTQEPNAAYRSYYHIFDSSDPATINALNNDGSQVSDLYEYISSPFWGQKMNATGNGYDWYGILSSDARPVAVDGNAKGLATTWKFHVRTGKDGLKYSTLSTKRASYNGRGVILDDYLTAFKLLLTKKNAYYRGTELAGQTGASGIVGAAAYYNASGDGFNQDAWDKVGITADSTDNSITIKLLGPCNQFNAMYTLAGDGNYEPIPQAFIDEVTPEAYGRYNTDKTTSPVDNILSLAPYTLESWQTDKEITFKKNTSWFERSDDSLKNRHKIDGIHVAILTGAVTDNTLPFKEFINSGTLDTAVIPDDYLDTYKTDPKTTTFPGDSTFKLNVNSTTKDQWASLFGTKGTIAHTADEASYWKVKPWMSNTDFLNGMICSINRPELAEKRGYLPSANYFADAYMSDPEKGISYNSTAEHKAALVAAGLANNYGYNLEASKALFKRAVASLTASGDIAVGTVNNPTNISLDCWWQTASQITKTGTDIKSYIEAAFNDSSVSAKTVKLTVNNFPCSVWSDVYYKHLMIGQFDLGFGSITGNALNPLNFFEVLKSDNSSGFTLNWGTDTSVVSNDLLYDGKYWSFNALWRAADSGSIVKAGIEVQPFVVKQQGEAAVATDGTITVIFTYTDNTQGYNNVSSSIDNFVITDEDTITDDAEDITTDGITAKVDRTAKTVTVAITAAEAALFKYGVVQLQLGYTLTIDGVSVASVATLEASL